MLRILIIFKCICLIIFYYLYSVDSGFLTSVVVIFHGKEFSILSLAHGVSMSNEYLNCRARQSILVAKLHPVSQDPVGCTIHLIGLSRLTTLELFKNGDKGEGDPCMGKMEMQRTLEGQSMLQSAIRHLPRQKIIALNECPPKEGLDQKPEEHPANKSAGSSGREGHVHMWKG